MDLLILMPFFPVIIPWLKSLVNVYDALKSKGLKSKLILQIHDELLIETVKDEVEQVREVLSHEMQNACSLAVKLEIDLHTGTDWYEAK